MAVSMSLLVTLQLASIPYIHIGPVFCWAWHLTQLDTRSRCSYRIAGLIASMVFIYDPNPVYLLTLSTCLWVWLLVSPSSANTSMTCIVTPWQPFIRKRLDSLVGIVHWLWTVWSSRSVNLTTHLQIRPELRNCGAIPLFHLYAFIACTRISLPLPVPIILQRAAHDHSQYRYPTPTAIWRSRNTDYVKRL